ncbi:hypothetical protein LWF15_16425 [Kineosporia rhizophila]|uniref:hypothetical protein n=1 Tax=Kineosporia TaxID=49184 RepID=UPI001E5580EC|nr:MULTISPECIES: hypothetical protein [Kineosporia]MCE0537089.1 hypothetical protein [Kineosporia rhizophila]GLY16066.1 hypothetical protein Kisp01_30810 [Kineosporia sp. NBRC 101677]
MAVAAPLLGLVLAGCGNGASGTTAEQTAPAPTQAATTSGETEAAEPTETARYDINLIMVCDVVEATLADLGAKPTVPHARSAFRKALTAAFETSTTPDATLRDVEVDNMLNEGCPGARSKALTVIDLDAMSKLAR